MNPYLRVFLISIVVSVGVLLRLGYVDGVDFSSRRTLLLLSVLAVASIVTTLLVGTFSSRADKRWSWFKTSAVSIGSWLGVLLLIALITQMK